MTHTKINNDDLMKEYPIQDDIWASRRWNKDRTDYIDLSGDCDENQKELNEIREDLENNNFVIEFHEFAQLMLNQIY